jgi:UDP-glucose 4-epimerase
VSQFLRWHLNNLPIPVVGDLDAKTRDFIHAYDLVTALILLAGRAASGEVVNVGSGEEVSMRQLANVIGEATGYQALLDADTSVLEDSYRLVGDVSRLRTLSFTPRIPLPVGVAALAKELGPKPPLPTVTTAFRRKQLAAVEG